MFVYVKRNKNRKCLLTQTIFQSLRLSRRTSYDIRIGQMHYFSSVDRLNGNKKYMHIPSPLFHPFLFHNKTGLTIWKKGRSIYLGPVIGIFVNSRYLSKLWKQKPPLSATKYIQANQRARCLLYFFSHKNINWKNKKIKGFYFSSYKHKWISTWLPFPSIVYDRYTHNDKQKQQLKTIRQKFSKHPGIKLINSGKLEKWKVYHKLSKHDTIKKYLPYTICDRKKDDVRNMLQRYGFIFVKSSAGSAGRDVLSIKKHAGAYHVIYYKKRIRKKVFKRIGELKRFVDDFIKGKEMIIQRGIPLLKYKGQPMDIRILLVKDGKGQWRAIYHQSRIAKDFSTITSYSLGGDLANYKDIYAYFKKRYKMKVPSPAHLTIIMIKVAKAIEKELGPFGEIGMDAAIDKKGKLWFLEGNSKPTKNPVPKLEDTKGISPQFLSILQYAKYLAGNASQ
jgi:hypothetical protein